jgi:hypothetical protein
MESVVALLLPWTTLILPVSELVMVSLIKWKSRIDRALTFRKLYRSVRPDQLMRLPLVDSKDHPRRTTGK